MLTVRNELSAQMYTPVHILPSSQMQHDRFHKELTCSSCEGKTDTLHLRMQGSTLRHHTERASNQLESQLFLSEFLIDLADQVEPFPLDDYDSAETSEVVVAATSLR